MWKGSLADSTASLAVSASLAHLPALLLTCMLSSIVEVQTRKIRALLRPCSLISLPMRAKIASATLKSFFQGGAAIERRLRTRT
jgi:hypothetical protein